MSDSVQLVYLSIRVPIELRDRIKSAAHRHETSLNQYLLTLLEESHPAPSRNGAGN
jgi:predicted HicB family RNase H-like nuclease